MKFLTFVDLHDDKKYLHELVSRAKEDDIGFVICAGDISQFGRGLIPVLKKFDDIGKKFYLIPGNHETDEMLRKVSKEFKNVVNFNQQAFKIDNYIFLGYGEGGFALEDAEFRKKAREWYSKYNGEKIVLVTHGPPYGTKIDLLGERHVGNKDYSKFIQRIKPKLVICGHLHETVNIIDEIEGIKIIHPGWEGMVIELS
ncbi:MAG: metallophosphoesterase [Nanoarchaeota archaeon]|nr:metallophosphoesterase [Nanoarchaeota archaeon]MBU1622316.1 metallophosphoesterase [Nanoarchaeota archaeon]MBU1974338.1 metallophosphoesterase [Nanoarchaeota archaeon]